MKGVGHKSERVNGISCSALAMACAYFPWQPKLTDDEFQEKEG